MTLEHIAVGILSLIGSLIGAGTVVILGWRKVKPEIEKTEAEANHERAEASTSWAQSNEMAARQLVLFQTELVSIRKALVESQSQVMTLEIKIETQKGLIKRLIAQIESLGSSPVK